MSSATPTKRTLLALLAKVELLAIARQVELPVTPKTPTEEILDALVASEKAALDKILPRLERETLKDLCRAFMLPLDGREKAVFVDRLLTAVSPTKLADKLGALPLEEADHVLEVEVQPRKPRLAWQGMRRKEAVAAVPAQIVEIVRPGLARDRGDTLLATNLRVTGRASDRPPASTRGERETGLPPNRLIWTNDNLVALQTLLEERDPATKAYRYRGKVDLVYIDPPFMVNSDFRADNTIDIDLDEDEGVIAKKEPSLVEHLAYRDTWRQGLDSFLSMLKRRLELLKELLAPTGSIYVHLDWHAVHYVKVLMDEIFGYENFVNEIIWKRGFSHNDLGQGAKHMGRVHDTLLVYAGGSDFHINPVFVPYEANIVRDWYNHIDQSGRRFQYTAITGPGGAAKGNPYYELLGHKKYWRYSQAKAAELVKQGRIVQPSAGAVPRYKRYLDEMPGVSLQDLWLDLAPVNSQAFEASGFPTQKPTVLPDRIITLSCPPGGLVLDCFAGSGTTMEAAERLGRRWIGIDNGKYAIHLARKRLIQLHGQPKPPEKAQYDFVECAHCKNIERKEKSQKTRETFQVRPFTVENMGVYQRAEAWQDFQIRKSRYRDEMIKVFGGVPEPVSTHLHGKKGAEWIHVGPLDGAVSASQIWTIARDGARMGATAVTVLSADFDTLSGSEKDHILAKTKVKVTIRVIPTNAIDEVRRRIELTELGGERAVESMAIPAFYAPLSIHLDVTAKGRLAVLTLERCEIDIASFLTSQQPILKPITEKMSASARRRVEEEHKKWAERKKELEKWLAKAKTWQRFIDFWAVDWDYDRRVGEDGKPIFETDWQSFRVRRGKAEAEPLVFTAETQYQSAGLYRIAAKVTDVFGNDGIATVTCEVG